MQKIAARYYRGSIISVIDLVVPRRKRVNVEPVGVEKIGKLLRPHQIKIFGETEFRTYLQQPLDNFEGCKTLCWIFYCCHNSCPHFSVRADDKITEDGKKLFAFLFPPHETGGPHR